MIVSWEWLQDYVEVDGSIEDVTDRLTMTGLNLEGIEPAGADTAIDLEVTSNRPDCLGHIGVSRELAALYNKPLSIPEAAVSNCSQSASEVTSVEIEETSLCPRYIARVIKGVKVGPSPDWLQKRLEALGIAAINNVVDVTNYVLMECGQPLHAFDLSKLSGQRIVVRPARKGEKLEAINHLEYELTPDNLVIADADKPVAIAGVMGGADTEIGDSTTEVLVETAAFQPLSVRNTARQLNLRSDSSYRFERGVDLHRLDWASRRCCELIMQTGGGELLEGAVVEGIEELPELPIVSLRFEQIPRLLGISVESAEILRILHALGLETVESDSLSARFRVPSWRRDLTREVDLIEEVARVHGYEQIREDPPLPVVATARTLRDRVSSQLRDDLTAVGMYEAITLTFISEEQVEWFRPFADHPMLSVDHSSRRMENLLRQSLIPSLLQSRRENERFGTSNAELFEIARVFLEARPDCAETDVEPLMLGIVSGRSFADLKGVIEELVGRLNPSVEIQAEPSGVAQFAPGRGCELKANGRSLGLLGELDRTATDRVGLRDAVTVAEIRVDLLEQLAELVPHFTALPQFPPMNRDMNLLLDEAVTWSQLEETVSALEEPLLESIGFAGQYRGKQVAADKKSYMMTLEFRASDRTLTTEEVNEAESRILKACEDGLGAERR